MKLNSFWVALLRRWYLTVGGVMLAFGITVLAVVRIGPNYEAEGSVLLLPPAATTQADSVDSGPGNPYLNLNGLSQARDVVLRSMKSRASMDALTTREPRAAYEFTPDYTTSAPVVVIDVTSHSAAVSTAGLEAAMEAVPQTLRSMQAGLKLQQASFITSKQLSKDNVPKLVRSGQVRTGIVVGVGVLTLSLLSLALVDGYLESRERRRTPRRHGNGSHQFGNERNSRNTTSTRSKRTTPGVEDGNALVGRPDRHDVDAHSPTKR